MQRRDLFVMVILLAGLMVGCREAAGVEGVEARVSGLPLESSKPEPGGAAEASAADSLTKVGSGYEGCPVTLPPEEPFSPRSPWPASAPYDRSWYGSESLWTSLRSDGRWDQLRRGDKAWWWSVDFDVSEDPQPELWMTARRLDGEGSVEQEPPATNGYHPDFHWAMLTGFGVPSNGCWEITGHYRKEGREVELSFVVWVAES